MSLLPPPVPVAFAPPRLTRNEAEGRTLLAQHVRRCRFTLGCDPWEISLEPLARGATLSFGANDWLVRAEWAGAPFELRLPATAADQWLRARFSELELPRLPTALRSAAFESALQDVLTALEATDQGPVRIDGIETVRQAPDAAATQGASHHFALRLARGSVTLWGTLATDALGLMLMAQLAAGQPAARGPVPHHHLPVLLRAEIGSATLSRQELNSLQPGEAILLEHSWVTQGGQLWLGHGGWGLFVCSRDGQLVVTQRFQMTEVRMNDDIDGPAGDGLRGDDMPVALDALPVRLQFDLGQRTMPLAQVSELQVGQVLDLARPLSQAVSIRANGALIGLGELMEIGGRIAVGITSLGRAREPAE